MINCCAQMACLAIKMIGSGLIFNETGACIHYTEFKIIQVGWKYLRKSECWLSWWIFYGNIVALKDGSIFNALCCNLKRFI